MSILYENIAALCEEKGIKAAKMCDDIGVSKSLMTDLKKGRKNGVNAKTAQKIASYFSVSVGYLLGEEKKEEKSTAEYDGLSENRNSLYERIITLCKERGVSGGRMCLELGLSKSTLTEMKYGRTKGVSTATAQKIASYFGVSVGYLLGAEEKEDEPTIEDDGYTVNICMKIKTARQAKGMTQEELGDILGVQKSAVAKYENGRVVNIKRSTLKKMTVALDIPPFELVFDEVEMKPTAEDDELSENIKRLVDFAKSVPEDKAELVLKLMRTIVEAD